MDETNVNVVNNDQPELPAPPENPIDEGIIVPV